MNKKISIPGFVFSGIPCGIKEKKGQRDLAAIYATEPKTLISGVFTQNQMRAAPARWCQKNIGDGVGRLVLINSGNANAATGKRGWKDCVKIAFAAAKVFAVKPSQVFLCSTGKIGVPLPVKKITFHLIKLKRHCGAKNFFHAAQAILTTDRGIKVAFAKGQIGKTAYTMAVMAKGAGMIHPNLATMLCFVLTDLKLKPSTLDALLTGSVDQTLNCLSVDGDTSTNDTVLMLASSLAKNKPFGKHTRAFRSVASTLTALLEDAALQIAADGEGATKCFIVSVRGAKTTNDARKVAHAIASSTLVKTALFGNDPNWGRILCATGYSGAKVTEAKTSISLGPVRVFARGNPVGKNERHAARYLRQNKLIDITVDLSLGRKRARAIGCDLTYDYVHLNAEYRT